MKRLFIAVLAVAALAACSKEQIVVADRGDAIGFDSFVDNATRAAADDFTTVSSFKVWGDVTGNVTGDADYIFLYNGADVTKGDNAYGVAWTCGQTEYWLPSATYNFMAISGATSVDPATGAFPTTINYTANGTTDLLLSEYVTVTTDSKSIPTTGVNNNKCVAFTFKHLLSKVYFKFTNTSTSDQCKFEISDIKISGAKATSSYDITTKTWATATGAASDFTFGTTGTTAIAQNASAPSSNACLFIPGEQTLSVSFKQKNYAGDTLMGEETITATLTPTFEANGCYVISVELKGGVAITFTVDEQTDLGWDSKTDISIP